MVVDAKKACGKTCQIIQEKLNIAITSASNIGITNIRVGSSDHKKRIFEETVVKCASGLTIEDLDECGIVDELKEEGYHVIRQTEVLVGVQLSLGKEFNRYYPVVTIAWGKNPPKKLKTKPTWWHSLWW